MFGISLRDMFLLYAMINSVESGRRLIGFNFKDVSPTGHKQCLKLCIGHADCLSVNFNRNRLLCELNSQDNDTVQVAENTKETEDFIFISRTSFPNANRLLRRDLALSVISPHTEILSENIPISDVDFDKMFIVKMQLTTSEDLAPPHGELKNSACPKGQMRVSRSTHEGTCVISREINDCPCMGFTEYLL